EFAVHNGVIHIGRYRPFSLPQEVVKKSTMTASSASSEALYGAVLDLAKPRWLETLQWLLKPQPFTLPPNHVEISVRAIGLNFSDVVYATGLLPSNGVVLRSSSPEFQSGEHVLGFQHGRGFTSHLLSPASRVLKVPTELCGKWTHTIAAALQCVYATALYALLDVGRLDYLVNHPSPNTQDSPTPTVLIHSACGGVGLAALQICRNLFSLPPSQIFCTVGGATADDKAQYLIDQYSIPAENIFSSRNPHDFYHGILAATSGRGVDLVLNSLRGNLLVSSWNLVAPNGKLLELGNRDLSGFGKLDMSRFLDNRSYCAVDVAYLARYQPHIIKDVLGRTLQYCLDGKLGPIDRVIDFEGSSAQEVGRAFRLLQRGEHIGKIVVNLPAASDENEEEQRLRQFDAVPYVKSWGFRLDAAYLLVGGAGGLGRSLAVWMVERGA
ncbi:hypothetical protein V8F06_009826, partial [Rhypophila decipiens]